MTHEQLEQLLERTVPLLEHQANCCNGNCKRSLEAKAILEEIGWG
jgi:hypothetical protein